MNARYTGTAIALHWLVFALIACGFTLGMYVADLPDSPQKSTWVEWHRWLGVTVFATAVVRLGWRLAHPPPGLPATVPIWQQRAAAAMHALLYVLMLAIPLTGWLHSSASGATTAYLGLLALPDLLTRDKVLAAQLKLLHATLNYALLALVALHADAALKHHLVEREDVLRRMLPGLKPPGD